MNDKRTTRNLFALGAAILVGFSGCNEQQPEQDPPANTADVESVTTEPAADVEAAPRVNTGADISNDPLVAEAGSMVYALDVSGMTCSGCANTVNDAVASIEGVQAVRVSLVNHAVWVSVDEAQAIPVDEITNAITEAGYTASIAGSDEDESDSESDGEAEDG